MPGGRFRALQLINARMRGGEAIPEGEIPCGFGPTELAVVQSAAKRCPGLDRWQPFRSRNRMEPLENRLPDWIDLEKARRRKAVRESFRIAIIDSGVETSHPELAGLQLADDVQIYSDGVKVAVREGDGSDLYGHGTGGGGSPAGGRARSRAARHRAGLFEAQSSARSSTARAIRAP